MFEDTNMLALLLADVHRAGQFAFSSVGTVLLQKYYKALFLLSPT